MSCPFSEEQLAQLQGFVKACKTAPQLLNHPSLEFFKDYIVSLGGNISADSFKPTRIPNAPRPPMPETTPEPAISSDSEPESEVELDMEGVIEGDKLDEGQIFGDANKISTEEEVDQSDEKRSAAMRHFSNQEFDEAINMYTEAIKLYPTSALLFAKRGQVYLKLNKPNACIKDCTHALELNCDSAASYKFRGRAHRLLGNFEQAAADLRESCKIDYDDQAQEWLLEVTPNADKLRAHNLNMQRRQEDKEHKEKLKRYQEAKAAHASAAQGNKPEGPPGAGGENPDFADAMGGGAGGSPFNMGDYMKLFNDPELFTALQDPEVAAAFQDAMTNPSNIFKYQNNPKVANILNKLASKVGPGGVPGFPGFTPPQPGGPPSSDDVGLD